MIHLPKAAQPQNDKTMTREKPSPAALVDQEAFLPEEGGRQHVKEESQGVMAATCNFCRLPAQTPQLFLGCRTSWASAPRRPATPGCPGVPEPRGGSNGVSRKGRGICLCAQAPSAVWMAAQHTACQLFSLVWVDTKARLLILIFLLRVLSAVSILVPEMGEFMVCPVARLEGAETLL